MARQYLFPCTQCDQKILIETTQAGQLVTCSGCKNQNKVGTLRDIKALATLESQSDANEYRRKSTKMGAVNRLVFVIAVLLIVIGGYWGVSRFIRANELQTKVDALQSRLNENLAPEKVKNNKLLLNQESPKQMLERWAEVDEDQVAEWKEHPIVANRRIAETNRLYAMIGAGLAITGLLGMLGAFTIKGRGPK